MADPTAATAEVVRARRFELVDREGRLRGVFGELPNPDDTIPPIFGVCLFDTKGRQRTFLCLDYMGPKLVFDSGGNNALELGVNDDAFDAEMAVYAFATDAGGSCVVGLRVDADGEIEITREGRAT